MRKADVRAWLGGLLEAGKSVELVNRIIRVFKTVLFHGVAELEVIERNVLLRFQAIRADGRQPREARESSRLHRGGGKEVARRRAPSRAGALRVPVLHRHPAWRGTRVVMEARRHHRGRGTDLPHLGLPRQGVHAAEDGSRQPDGCPVGLGCPGAAGSLGSHGRRGRGLGLRHPHRPSHEPIERQAGHVAEAREARRRAPARPLLAASHLREPRTSGG